MSEAVPRKDGFRRAAEETISRLRMQGYAKKTLINYEYAMRRTHEALAAVGTPPAPSQMTEAHMATIRSAFAYSPNFLSNVDAALRAMGCPYRIPYRIPPRSHVRWLEKDQAEAVLDAAMALGPPHLTVVHLELEMGFRRVSVQRARLEDFRRSLVYVRAKGSDRAANDYTIWPHPHLAATLRDTEAWRRAKGFEGRTDLLLPSRRTLGELSETALNNLLRRVSLESGVRPLSHHDLRRTFGRFMWKAGTPLPVVRDLMGHHSLDMTIRYLGIGADEMASAMGRFAEYMRTPSVYLTASPRLEKS